MDLANSTILKVIHFGEPKAVYLQSVFHLNFNFNFEYFIAVHKQAPQEV